MNETATNPQHMGEGRHRGRAVSSAMSVAQTGTPQVVIGWTNEHGDYATSYHAVTEKAWPYTEEMLVGLGWDPAEHDYDLSKLNAQKSPIKGAEANLVIRVEEYNGKYVPKVSVFADGPRRMDDNEAQELASSLRLNLKAWSNRPANSAAPGPARSGSPNAGRGLAPNTARGPARGSAAVATAHDDEDIPF